MNDAIGDMLIRIKNAGAVRKTSVSIPYTNIKYAIAEVLQKNGYVGEVSKKGKKITRSIEVDIAYDETKEPKVQGVKRVSKLSRRVYGKSKDLKQVRHGHGTLVVSTPKGVLTSDEAKKAGVGGELLFEIW